MESVCESVGTNVGTTGNNLHFCSLSEKQMMLLLFFSYFSVPLTKPLLVSNEKELSMKEIDVKVKKALLKKKFLKHRDNFCIQEALN